MIDDDDGLMTLVEVVRDYDTVRLLRETTHTIDDRTERWLWLVSRSAHEAVMEWLYSEMLPLDDFLDL